MGLGTMQSVSDFANHIPRVFLACPVYSEANVTMNMLESVMDAMMTPNIEISYNYVATSALPFCFNILWTQALNTRPYDYFVFLHSDIACDPGWLGQLIQDLEENDLDALSAVVAIKNEKLETSTAVLNDDESWTRLTNHDLCVLPRVFTSKDVGKLLLINTGVFICRFNSSWVEKRVWKFEDSIVQETNGKFKAKMFPEDWEFSIWARKYGLQIGATQNVVTRHLGCRQYTCDL